MPIKLSIVDKVLIGNMLKKNTSVCALILILFVSSCGLKEEAIESSSTQSEVWFKQTNLSLGYRIEMIDSETGYAISRGKGGIGDDGENGQALFFKNGRWIPFDEFEYSDFPIIKKYDNAETWYLTHETYKGFYKPHLYSFSNNLKKEIPLPKVMWDATDYSMWLGLSVTKSGKACLVGQRGNIIFYDGANWKQMQSPVYEENSTSIISGDLHDVQLLTDTSGWAVGKNGVIIKLTEGKWEIFESPTQNDLFSLFMVDNSFGWAVGANGTIIKYENGRWVNIDSEFRIPLNSVKALSRDKALIAGSNSTLLKFENDKWTRDNSINTFDDVFEDIAFIKENDHFKIWIIGKKGIYTNSQNMKFSFTDITSQASLRKEGRGGVFFDANDDDYPELLVLSEEGQNNFYQNNLNNTFTEISREINENKDVFLNQTISVADINNDGYNDILELTNDLHYKISFGRSGFNFIEHTDPDYLRLDFIQSDTPIATAKFIDFDNDGNLDLYVSNYNSADMLLQNDGTGRFKNVFEGSGVNKILNNRSFGATFADFNNDRLIDIVISYRITNENRHISLFINNGDFKFSEKIDSTFFANVSPSTFSLISDDFNNDGNADLLVFNNTLKLKMLVNNGNSDFKNVTDLAGLSEPILHPSPVNGVLNAADVNNDGWIDIFIGSKLYLNSPEFVFTEVTEQVGINFTGNPSFTDIENDGDMDLFIGSSVQALGEGVRAALFRNNLIISNFVKFDINGDYSNRSGIGAKIILYALDDENKIVYKSSKQVGVGSSPMVQQDFTKTHFGLNPNYNYFAKIIFPSGVEKNIELLETNKTIRINESSFIERYLVLTGKSIKRTLLLMNFGSELLRLLIFSVLILLLMFFNKKLKIRSLIYKWYSIVALLVLFFLTTHFTIASNIYQSIMLSSLLPFLLGIGIIYYSNRYLQKKESKFISHYKLLELLGVGGTGKVFKAIDTISKNTVAVKVLNKELLNDEENRKRLSSEGRLLSSLDHPNIIKVLEFGESENRSFVAMEYLEGGTLYDYVDKNYPLANDKVLEIIEQICLGLKEIHSNNIIHRDLKSQNIMFDGIGTVRIMDFGLSKSPLVSTMTSLGTVVGTLGYVAPEQVTNVYVDQRCDIFSLGVVIYQMVTKKLPFTGENEIALIHSIFNTQPEKPKIINENCDPEIEALTLKCIEKEPDQRFKDVEDIISAIEKIKDK